MKMKLELKNLFGTKRVILNDKEVKQYIKEKNKQNNEENEEFTRLIQIAVPRMFYSVLISAAIVVVVAYIFNLF